MVNENLKMAPDWPSTLDQFKIEDCFQYKVENEKSEKAKLRQVINRVKKKTNKNFTTNSLLGGGFEIKRTK